MINLEKSKQIVCPYCGKAFNCKDVNDAQTKAQKRLSALKERGVDTSALFAMQTGEIAKLNNGVLSVLDDNDPIFSDIVNNGTIPNHSLFRRWVMSQMFHMLSDGQNFHQNLRKKGYGYMFKMLERELKVQCKLYADDKENFYIRNSWFNQRLVMCLCESYCKALEKHIANIPERKCKNIPYKHIGKSFVFCEDIYKKIISPLLEAVRKIRDASSPKELYQIYKNAFMRKYIKINEKMDGDFIDAYKGCGAYYTMQNLILFHGCTFAGMSMQQSYDYIKKKQKAYSNHDGYSEGWRMFAVMKELLEANNISIERKLKEICRA